MQVFRKKYLYNPDNPIFQSENVQTFNCMNTQTKDNKLIILRHLKEPPFVDPSAGMLQPLEQPTLSQPFSIYPLVYCCSQIGKTNEPDAMYIVKCLIQAKIKDPLYCVLSPQGVCVSEVEGLLPNRSPSLFELAVQLLGLDAALTEREDSVVSRDAYQICKGLRDGQNVTSLLATYGWNNPKKEKEQQRDDQFWIFKGKRKQEGPFGEEYSLAWLSKYGLTKFKYIDLSKDGYEEQFFSEFARKLEFFKQNQDKSINTAQIFKYGRDNKGFKLFMEILNQGTLADYITKRHQLGRTLNEKSARTMLQNFVQTMRRLSQVESVRAHGSIHIKNLYVHNHRIVLGEPLLVTDKIEKKLRQLKTSFDYYAPEMKENIILPQNLFKLSFQKMDVWSFGLVLHKVLTREIPAFDPTRKPILSKSALSPGMLDLITRCLSLTPAHRPSWHDIHLEDLQSGVVVEDLELVEEKEERSVIRLGTSKEAASRKAEQKQYEPIRDEEVLHISEKDKLEEQAKQKEQQQQKFENPIPVQISLRLKRIKLVVKVIAIMLLYIFVFFRDFLANSIGILLVRSYYGTTTLNLVDNNGNALSSTVIITNQPNYFLLNDISFSDIQNVYNCINNQFDPIYNPSYSLLSYVQSPPFLALLLTGWFTILLICVTKAISIWKGGISNRPSKGVGRYLLVYAFHELSLASLLFAHFFIYQFFYFASGTPCFSMKTYTGVQPYFDSTLYLFLSNPAGYLGQVFSSLGVLSILVLLSSCYYAWGPKLDQKYFLSVPSILFRLIPFILLILICRIGVFTLFSPSAMNDSASILPQIVKGSSNGFFGIIPEVFIVICVTTELLLELFFYWCERKAAESDKLARLFNLKSKKVSTLEDSAAHLNDMSLVKNQSRPNDEVFT